MDSSKIRVNDLKIINYISDKSRSLAMNIMARHYKHQSKNEKLKILEDVKNNPEAYFDNEFLGPLAGSFLQRPTVRNFKTFELLEKPGLLNIFGQNQIEDSAIAQMELAMQLPISVQGALMPDAHHGYGLPIGGVLIANNAVIPYGVGLDIGCRMSLSICNLGPEYLNRYQFQVKTAMKAFTHFGINGWLDFKQDHEVLDRVEFHETDLLRKLQPKAVRQLGSSGSGNHFVEFGVVELWENTTAGILKKMLHQKGVSLIGGSTEEAPLAYKDIEEVMNHQKMLVNIEGKFYPKIVRMNKE